MPVEVMLHQAVFGYDAGHNLLAASCTLSAESRRTLAVLTDAPGPWPTSGFDLIFTGTPLPDMPYYALFCTWPAPEMPRPGCVWSHVILIELADLAGLADLGELCHCFRRPSKTVDQKWRDPLHFVVKRDIAAPIARGLQRDCQRFLAALYAKPQLPFVAEALNAETYADLVFALWSQQWPRLRRNFRFSTGSFADRGRVGAAFDLQVTPTSSRRAWQRSDGHLLSEGVDSPTEELPADSEQWIRIALDDLLAPSKTGFRSFLCAYGTDVNHPRGAFARLATAYHRLGAQPCGDWTEKLCSIGEIFPDESEAVRLKEWLVAPDTVSNSEQDLDRAWATASFLLGARQARAYASVSFDHAGLAPYLWKRKRQEVLSLLARLIRQQENPASTAFAAAVANAVQPGDLQLISDQRPEFIPIFLSHRATLAFEVGTWQLPERIQWQIIEVLDRLSLDQKDWGEIMAAMFLAPTNVSVREAVENAGPYAIQGAFRWLDSGIAQELLPSQFWREALAVPAVTRLGDPELLPPAALALCAWFAPPETVRQLLSASRQDVQQLARQPLDVLPPPLRSPTAFLLVTLGLRAESAEGMHLLLRGFFEVHDALTTTSISSESWSLLSPELPQLGWWRNWDRCERLRRAVRQWLSKYVKTGNPLLDVATRAEHREIAHRTLSGESENDEFID